MKKLVILLSCVLLLSFSLHLLIIRKYLRTDGVASDMMIANSHLSEQLFFECLEDSVIEIFVAPNETPDTFQRKAYIVKLRPLYDPFQELGSTKAHFVEHSQRVALEFACHAWVSDRQLSLFLIRLLAGRSPAASVLWQCINSKGEEHPQTADYISRQAELYRWHLEPYQKHYPGVTELGSSAYRKGLSALRKDNNAQARLWFAKAAEMGNSSAQTKLGMMYLTGHKRSGQNYEKAKKWLEKAARSQHPEAFLGLGVLYEQGKGSTQQDFGKAASYYRKAADAGDADGMYLFARMLEEGRGVEQDVEAAIRYYREATENGHVDAANDLAYLYAQRGTDLDYAENIIEAALATQPQSATILDTFGWVLYKQHKYDKAMRQLQEAVKINPASAVYHDHLAYVYDKLEQYENARLHWKRALELTEDDELAKEVEANLKQLP